MENSLRPKTAPGGYDQMDVFMRYESHGNVETKAMQIIARVLYRSTLVRRGRSTAVSKIANGMVYFTCLNVSDLVRRPLRRSDLFLDEGRLTPVRSRRPLCAYLV